MAEREEKKRAMELAIAQIEKQFGKGSIMKLGATEAPPDVPVIPSGSLGLDLALGTGGLPRGRVIEIFGPESSGKTTLMLHTIAEAQKTGGTAAFIDAEHALDLTYAEKLGVNTADLLAGVRLRHQQVGGVDAQLLGVSQVQRMLRVDEGGRAAGLLGLRNRMQHERGLPGRLRTKDLNDAAAWQPARA